MAACCCFVRRFGREAGGQPRFFLRCLLSSARVLCASIDGQIDAQCRRSKGEGGGCSRMVGEWTGGRGGSSASSLLSPSSLSRLSSLSSLSPLSKKLAASATKSANRTNVIATIIVTTQRTSIAASSAHTTPHEHRSCRVLKTATQKTRAVPALAPLVPRPALKRASKASVQRGRGDPWGQRAMEVESNYYDPEAILAEETVSRRRAGADDGRRYARRRPTPLRAKDGRRRRRKHSLAHDEDQTTNNRWSPARSDTAWPRWPRSSCPHRTAET